MVTAGLSSAERGGEVMKDLHVIGKGAVSVMVSHSYNRSHRHQAERIVAGILAQVFAWLIPLCLTSVRD